MRDLVTYDVKHNGANGECNRDGTEDNRSWNCGVEGETEDGQVNALRHRQTQNLMATLLLAAGVPMITAGDELGRTQQGNNNAYCQDSPISWVHWDTVPAWSDPVRRPGGCSSCEPSTRSSAATASGTGRSCSTRPASRPGGEHGLVRRPADGDVAGGVGRRHPADPGHVSRLGRPGSDQ